MTLYWIRAVAFVVLGLVGLGGLVGNCAVVFSRRERPPSMVLILPGLIGAAALLVAPFEDVDFASWWWVPLLLDWGGALGVLAFPFYYLRNRLKKANESGRTGSDPDSSEPDGGPGT